MSEASDFWGEGRPSLQDRIDIQDVISAITFYADICEFDKMRQFFTEDAYMDYSALFGEVRAHVPAQQFITDISKFVPGFDAQQSQVTNFDIRVTGDNAYARSHVHAFQRIGERIWYSASVYRHTLVRSKPGWKVKI